MLQHLTSIVGAEVEVALEIHAHIPDGASPELVRTITENCRTLRFTDHGFEEQRPAAVCKTEFPCSLLPFPGQQRPEIVKPDSLLVMELCSRSHRLR